MPKRGPADLAREILVAIHKIEVVTDGLSEGTFCDDFRIHDVVLMNLIVIAESVKQFLDDVKRAIPDVQWHRIIGLRKIVSHTYGDIDLPTIWNVVQQHLPILAAACRRITSTPY
jgi:uncharacterized protein with HEPN domain